jgi:hypothetical protein
MTEESKSDAPAMGATGEGGAASPAESLPHTSEKGIDLWGFLEQCTPEGRWFLKALQHFNSKAEDRAEVRINKYDDGITISTYKSKLSLAIEKDTFSFWFRREPTRHSVIVGVWHLHIGAEKAKEIINEFLAAIESAPLSLGDIIEVVERIDNIIRKERES